jgi:hypothetical protein
MREVPWKQHFITLSCFAAIGLSHYAGPVQGTLVSAVVAYLLWLRSPPPGPPPALVKAAASVIFGVTLGHYTLACAPNALTPADDRDLSSLAAQVALCNTQPDPVACKAAVKAAFDAQEAAKFADAGGYVAP